MPPTSFLRGQPAWFLVILILLPVSLARLDPTTNRIRVIFLGEIKTVGFPFPGWIEAEPKFTLQRVPCDLEWFSDTEARRFTRLYLPRTYEELVASYDAFIFEDFTLDILPSGTLDDFQRAIGDLGIGIALIEYVFWSQNLNRIDAWMASEFYAVFAAEATLGRVTNIDREYYEVVRELPVFGMPDPSRWPMNWASHGDLISKEGATVHAIWRGRQTPAVVSRDYGQGRVLQTAHGWDNIPSSTVAHYSYLPDLIFNKVLFVAGVPPPKDFMLVHGIRLDLIQLRERKLSMLALMEFVDRFGADTRTIGKSLLEFDSLLDGAQDSYLVSEYETASATLSEAMDLISGLEKQALVLKDRALLWIYLVEWLAVSATFLISGAIVWEIMVGRRLYRAVGTTRIME